MKISLSPMRRDDTLTVEKTGDRLRINDELFNFGPLPDGATINAGVTPCDWIVGPVKRVNGEIVLTLILPTGPSPSQAVAFPEPLTNVPDGLVVLPFDPPPAQPTMPSTEAKESADVDG